MIRKNIWLKNNKKSLRVETCNHPQDL